MMDLHDGHIRDIGIDWPRLVRIVEETVRTREAGEYASPLKSYLRFGDPANRIIATPAYVGGETALAGIKWVASFPGNLRRDLPRANNTILLNDPETGRLLAVLRSNLLNGLRAAAVSGLALRNYADVRQPEEMRLGIIGWGPIGRLHLEMAAELLGSRLTKVMLYDLQAIDPASVPEELRERTEAVPDWRTLYRDSNAIATCTVPAERYIDEPPPAGALLLNVSLRDYRPESVAAVKNVIVDDWREVCRENTDIEQLHLRYGLAESDVFTLADLVCGNEAEAIGSADQPVFFNPMGLGIFDIAIAGHYYREALRLGAGVVLADGDR
ncbi:2,3-diaminopropionate biosynthesis protein SbnB [Cohnella sp. REN36]|uniref:2,3-diaminopropionate biosynthesis protein SbnB n=1 Tax=Cohnella sp. REN36 TaxID=2887347 RepID=UPI001D13A813|nr:2,3-diaminopropionate biosynthesis protein SbnB [Cohnella sp. REN36]MCC3374530.1 2,3-diaminopropionate biosynthesis protein SbnB [Cohnella sp. REN36]